MGDGSGMLNRRATSLGSSTLPPSAWLMTLVGQGGMSAVFLVAYPIGVHVLEKVGEGMLPQVSCRYSSVVECLPRWWEVVDSSSTSRNYQGNG